MDGLCGVTRGNGTCRAVRHAHDKGHMDKTVPITELTGKAKHTMSISDESGVALSTKADTGVLTSVVVETFASSEESFATNKRA